MNQHRAAAQPRSRRLSSGLQAIGDVMTVAHAAGISNERTILLGFSQGACLAIEYSARNPRTYGGIACLSGGLIDPMELSATTPAIWGIRQFFVMLRLYAGMGHLVNDDEIAAAHAMMTKLIGCS